MKRRTLLAASAGGAAGVGTAGIGFYLLQEDDERLPECPPMVNDPPETVYRPSHRDDMVTLGTATAGGYGIGLTYMFPHPFWLVTGEEREYVEPSEDNAIHLMAVVWDIETEIVLPIDTGPTIEVTDADGNHIDERAFWPMLSQPMGYHFGENLIIPEAGKYTARVSLPAMSAARTGTFEERFEERVSTEIDFSFDPDDISDLACEAVDDAGESGALEPMEMDMLPLSMLPPIGELPGRILGTVTTSDATLTLTVLNEKYLAVLARTPYNEYPLVAATLSTRIERDDETIFEQTLRETLDPELGVHYGTEIDVAVESDDEIRLSIDTPPQIARHAGYQNAFIDRPDVSLSIE
ncbi:DUF7350 domain-containing protein [Natronococcus jeotgali]|uniref:DUF7350 domain-containing protein n=1 Tax=Natronococcus jeotgali DSM 18795 TaxID=1227498 RepID=L9XCE2_9EURY|nr:hypothetical protein [Natronococcus jeotgali]ELY59307.1 hypothetical protein C492_11230 [Natronococcus jeotgali DSM 18795]